MTTLQTVSLYGAFGSYLLAVLLYLAHLPLRRPWVWRNAFLLVLAGFALQTLCLGLRWWQGGYLPVTNLFGTQFFFSWALAVTIIKMVSFFIFSSFRICLFASFLKCLLNAGNLLLGIGRQLGFRVAG